MKITKSGKSVPKPFNLQHSRHVDLTLDLILEYIHNLIRKNRFNELDDKIQEVAQAIVQRDEELSEENLTIWSSYLTFTLPIKNKLPSRPKLYEAIELISNKMVTPEETKELLHGLE